MGLDPDLATQERILDELRLRQGGLGQREALVERAFGGAFVVVALALALAGEWGGASLVAVAGATLAFVVSARVEFDISGGFVAPTQLAFVPLLFVAPATHVPLIVGVAWVCARVPDLLGGKTSLARLWVAFGNGWYSLGPALVLIVAGAHDAGDAGPWVLLDRARRPVRRGRDRFSAARGVAPRPFAPGADR